MTGGTGGGDQGSPDQGAPDLEQLARDWVTLWQSELAAMATDRETQETWQALLALWAGAAGAMLHAAPRHWPANDRPARRPGTVEPPRTAPAAAAPDARDAAIERLTRHIGELEARLAELEHGVRGNGGGDRSRAASPARRRKRSGGVS